MLHDKKRITEQKCSCKCETSNENNCKNENKCCEYEFGENGKKRVNNCKAEADIFRCGCCCEHENEEKITPLRIGGYIVGAAILALAFFGEFEYFNKYVAVFCAVIVYIAFSKDVWLGAINDIKHRRAFTEFTLMCVATVGAIALGEFSDAAAVVYLYSLGETVSQSAYRKSKSDISRLIDVTEETVTVVDAGKARSVKSSQVCVGDVLSVRVGDKISLDGVVIEGGGYADTSVISGESVPRELAVGDKCLSGYTLISGAIYIKVENEYENSTASKLKRAVERASKQKAVREKRITRFASVFTPLAFGVAVAVLVTMWIFGDGFGKALRAALVVLVASCPCSLVLSVPLAYFSGIGRAASRGIAFKSGQTIDNVAELGTLVFDKTGTLTDSAPSLTGISVAEKAPVSKGQILDIAKSALLKSPHVLARVFCEKYNASVSYKVENVKNIGGRGLACLVNGRKAAFGNRRFMEDLGIKVPSVDKSVIYISLDGIYCGALLFEAKLKENALSRVSAIRAKGVNRVALMSGDNELAVRKVADEISISEFYFELKPDEKLAKFEHIYKEEKRANLGRTVGFCGDGLNDSAVIARADVGIAMGSGSALTVEAADVVIVDDNLSGVSDMIDIAQKTVNVVKQNIAISLGVKAAVVVIGLFGFPSLELAVLADVGAAVVTVFNAMRAGRVKK